MAVGDAAGAGAVVELQRPTLPGTLHASSGPSQARSQHTRSAQGSAPAHWALFTHPPPCGTGVLVGDAVGVAVGLWVGVVVGECVAVPVAVLVAVAVRVDELVTVCVAVAVLVAVAV